jgi:hypothetical protein
MNEKWKNIQYDEKVIEKIDFLNQILTKLKAPPVFDNPNFTFEESWTFETCVRFKVNGGNNSLPFDIQVETGSLRIDILDYDEAYEISDEYFDKKKEEVIKVFTVLFSGYVLVEYKGNSKFINFFFADGNRESIWSLGSLPCLITGRYLKSQKMKQHLFFPVYPN